MTDDLLKLWAEIDEAGSQEAYIRGELERLGYLVQRRDVDDMSKRQLADYKKALKKEAAERRRLKKEVWQAYKTANIVHLGEGVYWNDAAAIDKWDHPKAEERAAENELPPLDKPAQLAEALHMDVAELRWLAWNREAAKKIHYRRFTIPKRNGGEREIWAPLPKIKAAQSWILRNIAERLPVHGAAHGFLAGRSIVTNAAVHTNAGIVVRVDLKDFFPTVTFPRVKGIFRKAGYREQTATLLALLCTESPRQVIEHENETWYIALGPRCLPQGAPTSPALTNTLCFRLDQRLTGLTAKMGWRYTRYADDLTFSLPTNHQGEPKLGYLLNKIPHIVEEEGFAVNEKKTWVARKGGRQAVTGLTINGKAGPRVSRELKRNMRAAIHNLKQGKSHEKAQKITQLIGNAAFIYMVEPILGAKLLAELRPFLESSK
ncbi:MAG: reverse transcriptase domain-containing protein [Acidobacteriota bacterium]|nr:reverse transcriptase domain-containing protein [Acidobacteriota bacterium]